MNKNFFILLFVTTTTFSQCLVEPPYLHSYGIRKATPAKLFMFFGPITEFDDPQGLAAVKMNSRDDPKTEDDDDEVVVYGVNSGRNQLIYNTSMWALAIYGKKGSGKGQFLAPRGVAADVDGNVYVADCGNNRIVHLFNPKKEVQWVKAFSGASGSDPGLVAPSQVALDSKSLIYVTDTGNRRIAVFSRDGTLVKVFPEAGRNQFEQGPSMLAVADGLEPWSFFRTERIVFCADWNGARLWKLGLDGAVLRQIDLPAGHHAAYATVDYYHDLWITDKENHCILKYDHNLALLDIFGSYGEGKNQFVEPRGITMWKRYGQMFVAEKQGAQYFWVGTECKQKSLHKNTDNSYTLSLTLPEFSFVSLYSRALADTVWVMRRRFLSAGKVTVPFRDDRKLINGQAPLVLRVEPTYSSYIYYKWDYPVTIQK